MFTLEQIKDIHDRFGQADTLPQSLDEALPLFPSRVLPAPPGGFGRSRMMSDGAQRAGDPAVRTIAGAYVAPDWWWQNTLGRPIKVDPAAQG